MKKFISSLFGNSEGATAIEYGLIAALIAVAAITAMSALGEHLQHRKDPPAAIASANP
ncbi:MAG: hypothetical protein B7X02_02830 [Rhodospirillales bacterium 12-54-5]|nr:MAG: hypothetical protein B7X02_02830 [Rhodospirillales bacterium 12-54-5]